MEEEQVYVKLESMLISFNDLADDANLMAMMMEPWLMDACDRGDLLCNLNVYVLKHSLETSSLKLEN